MLMVLATALPTMLWAQDTAGDGTSDEVLPPMFRFDGDSLIIETATENASIFYQIADLPNMDEATIEKISSSMTVTADVQQSIYYHQPIEITKSVIVKAIAAGATISEVSTLIYDYDAWQKLLEATDYAMDVSARASDNANVPGELKEQLSNMVEEAKWAYYERMWESQAVTSFTSELMQLAHQIDEMMATVAEPEPYAVLSYSESSFAQMWGIDYTKTLTFYFDDQKESRGGMSIIPFSSYESVPWVGDRDSITTVVFDSSFAEYKDLTSTAYWFDGCQFLSEVLGIGNLHTDNVTDMNNMFNYCYSLKSLDVSGFNTANVTTMNGMFSSCFSLTALNVSGFNTANVTDMSRMFSSCSSLTALNVNGFNTSNVTDMSNMFSGCSALVSIDVSNFNTSNVTDMSSMFSDCTSLTSLDLSSFNTANVTDMGNFFYRCSNLSELNVLGFNSENVTNMERMFWECSNLTTLDVSSFNTSIVLSFSRMFSECPNLTTIYAGDGWTTESIKTSTNMFTGSTSLVGGKGTTYDANHVDYTYAHIDGGPSNPGYFTRSGEAPYVPVDATFDSNGVLAVGGTTTMTDALESVGGRDEVAKTITAIVWNSSATLTNSDLQGLDNPNMLIYVNSSEQAPDRDNVVVGDFAKNIVLKDVESGNNNFYCPQAFTAEMMSYTRDFQQQTEIGVSRGWETIALPFTVQTIMHEKNGVIAPFGNDASGKHFWLRQLTQEGIARATAIQANTPYVISMPNNNEYPGEFNLAGRVTFSSQNVTVPVTTDYANSMLDTNTNTMIVFYPAMHRVAQSEETYALNVSSAQAGYAEGSVFVAGLRDVRPFEAYTWHHAHGPAPRYIPISELNGGATAIESLTPSLSEGEGAWYDLKGRRLLQKPVLKGVYLHNGRKVVMK